MNANQPILSPQELGKEIFPRSARKRRATVVCIYKTEDLDLAHVSIFMALHLKTSFFDARILRR
jgi:hypothetical protein